MLSLTLYVCAHTANGDSPTSQPPMIIIAGVSPISGAIGSPVTIKGTNFGGTQGSSTVTFNGTGATATSWSAASITVTVPTGATSGTVVVTVGGQASNGVSFTVTTSGPITVTVSPVRAGLT